MGWLWENKLALMDGEEPRDQNQPRPRNEPKWTPVKVDPQVSGSGWPGVHVGRWEDRSKSLLCGCCQPGPWSYPQNSAPCASVPLAEPLRAQHHFPQLSDARVGREGL